MHEYSILYGCVLVTFSVVPPLRCSAGIIGRFAHYGKNAQIIEQNSKNYVEEISAPSLSRAPRLGFSATKVSGESPLPSLATKDEALAHLASLADRAPLCPGGQLRKHAQGLRGRLESLFGVVPTLQSGPIATASANSRTLHHSVRFRGG